METKCPMCGAPMENGVCSYCGYAEKKTAEPSPGAGSQQPVQQQVVQPQVIINPPQMPAAGIIPGVSRKRKTVALLLCIFFGYAGFHKFYVGKIGMGILYLLTLGFLGVGWLVDILLIATGNFKDEFDLPLRQ